MVGTSAPLSRLNQLPPLHCSEHHQVEPPVQPRHLEGPGSPRPPVSARCPATRRERCTSHVPLLWSRSGRASSCWLPRSFVIHRRPLVDLDPRCARGGGDGGR